MTIYLGELGRLIELWSTPSAQVQTEDYYSVQTTVEGVRRAQRKPVSRRTWSVSAAYSTPADTAVLDDFASGAWGPGPFLFVPADAPTSNMLTPQAASTDPVAGMRVSDVPDGPLLTPDGWAPRSIRATEPDAGLWFGNDFVPVVDRKPVTVSAYLRGAGAAVRTFWYDANGSGLGTNTSSITATAGTVVRSWMTVTPPVGAASLRVRAINATQGTRPAATWGTDLYPWSDGRGCLKAIVNGVSRESLIAGQGIGRQFENISYTVTEVG